MEISAKIRKLMVEMEPEFIEDFKFLHQHPEHSFTEYETTDFIKKRLLSLGIEILDYGLETGVVGYLEGDHQGPCIALRADIDGLPIQEEADCEYRSLKNGYMHACGHDTHMGSLLAAARMLAACRGDLHGKVKFLFQPAEEVNLGAKYMITHQVLEEPKVSAIYGLHNSTEIPTGTIAVKKGPLMAAVSRIHITVTGEGGHGGTPHRTADPIVCAAAIIMSAQTIVSRNVSPFESCAVSICNVQASKGKVNNVIPDMVEMYGTVRTFCDENTALIEDRLWQIVRATSEAYGCVGNLEFVRELDIIQNSELYNSAYQAVKSVGAEPVTPIPSTGGEDFSEFQKVCRLSFFYWLGTRNEDSGAVYPWHSPKFKADPRCIAIGGGVYAMSVFETLKYLEQQKNQNQLLNE